MKKTVITALSVLMISAGGAQATTYAHAGQQADGQSTYSQLKLNTHINQHAKQDIKNLEEYAAIATAFNPEKYTAFVAEDNVSKRVILFSDDYGRPLYKSIFVKKTGLLKVIGLKGQGLVVKTIIKENAQTTAQGSKADNTVKQKSASSISNLPEYKKLAAHFNVASLKPFKVTDNHYNRTIIFKNSAGQSKYKSIFVKRTGMLKIIDLRAGQIYYGPVK